MQETILVLCRNRDHLIVLLHQTSPPIQNIAVVAFYRPTFSLSNCNEFANRKFAAFFCTLMLGWLVDRRLKDVEENGKEQQQGDDCTEKVVQVKARLALMMKPGGSQEEVRVNDNGRDSTD